MTAELIHRLHFAFTITFHYLFPQLTMGLALLIVVLKSVALKTGSEEWDRAARFWGRIFAINFVFGVVTGIPMEFEFGTNWARFARFSGGVIGQPLAMEGVFSFFMESAFLGLFLYGEKRLSKTLHWFSAVMVFVGSWISGFFIIVTDAWMQHPVSYDRLPNGQFEVLSFWQLLLNPWGLLQYAHNMTGAVITGSFVMSAVGAFYLLDGRLPNYGRIFLKVGVTAERLWKDNERFGWELLALPSQSTPQPIESALMACQAANIGVREGALVEAAFPSRNRRNRRTVRASHSASAYAPIIREIPERRDGEFRCAIWPLVFGERANV
jgi:cytochrome bd-type quinol oxidase subunit 1